MVWAPSNAHDTIQSTASSKTVEFRIRPELSSYVFDRLWLWRMVKATGYPASLTASQIGSMMAEASPESSTDFAPAARAQVRRLSRITQTGSYFDKQLRQLPDSLRRRHSPQVVTTVVLGGPHAPRTRIVAVDD